MLPPCTPMAADSQCLKDALADDGFGVSVADENVHRREFEAAICLAAAVWVVALYICWGTTAQAMDFINEVACASYPF